MMTAMDHHPEIGTLEGAVTEREDEPETRLERAQGDAGRGSHPRKRGEGDATQGREGDAPTQSVAQG